MRIIRDCVLRLILVASCKYGAAISEGNFRITSCQTKRKNYYRSGLEKNGVEKEVWATIKWQ